MLGAGIWDDGTIAYGSLWRAIHAGRVYKDGFRDVIVAGGGEYPVPIAQPIRDYLVFAGVPAERIQIETKSRSTRENGLFVKDMLAGASGRAVLLTSDYHMFRARRVFQKLGVPVEARPVSHAVKLSACWYCRWDVFRSLTAETAKIGYYWARGWI